MQSSNKGRSTESSFIPEMKKGLCLVAHSLNFLSVIPCAWTAEKWNSQGISFKHDKKSAPNLYKAGLKDHWETWDRSNWTHFWLGRLRWGFAVWSLPQQLLPQRWLLLSQAQWTFLGRKARGRELSASGTASPCLCSLLRTVPGLASRWYRSHTSRQKSFAGGIIGGKNRARKDVVLGVNATSASHGPRNLPLLPFPSASGATFLFYCPTYCPAFLHRLSESGRMHTMFRIRLDRYVNCT